MAHPPGLNACGQHGRPERFALFLCVLLFAVQELSLVQLRGDGTMNSPLKKLLSPEAMEELLQRSGSRPGDLLLIAAGSLHTVVSDDSR